MATQQVVNGNVSASTSSPKLNQWKTRQLSVNEPTPHQCPVSHFRKFSWWLKMATPQAPRLSNQALNKFFSKKYLDSLYWSHWGVILLQVRTRFYQTPPTQHPPAPFRKTLVHHVTSIGKWPKLLLSINSNANVVECCCAWLHQSSEDRRLLELRQMKVTVVRMRPPPGDDPLNQPRNIRYRYKTKVHCKSSENFLFR